MITTRGISGKEGQETKRSRCRTSIQMASCKRKPESVVLGCTESRTGNCESKLWPWHCESRTRPSRGCSHHKPQGCHEAVWGNSIAQFGEMTSSTRTSFFAKRTGSGRECCSFVDRVGSQPVHRGERYDQCAAIAIPGQHMGRGYEL